MANENLKKMLELSKKLEKTTAQNRQQVTAARPVVSQKTLDEQVNQFDQQVYGKYALEKTSDGRPVYDAEADMQHLQEMFNNGANTPDLSHSKLPSAIIQSFMDNPLTIDPSTYKDPKMEALTERIGSKFKKEQSGLKAAQNIQQRLDESDKAKVAATTQTTSSVDYSIIKAIVESVFNEKINELKTQLLSENNTHSGQSMKAMTIRDNKFMFLTNDGDIYECEMKYKGKNKRK